MTDPRAILLVQCPDRPGIVAAISSFLFRHGANITDFDQHTSEDNGGVYFTRLEFQTAKLDLPLDDLKHAFALDVARPFAMDWRLTLSSDRQRVAVLVSKHDHALLELLWTWKRGDLRADVTHRRLEPPGPARAAVESFGVPVRPRPELEGARGPRPRRGWASSSTARSTWSCSPATCRSSRRRSSRAGRTGSINIHHSFLPAFVGADPYRQAYERGVKVVGATAHYVTADLDAGPIIDQDVARVVPPRRGRRPEAPRPRPRAAGARPRGPLGVRGPGHRRTATRPSCSPRNHSPSPPARGGRGPG